MIDTVAFLIPGQEIEIQNPDAFSPSATGLIRPPYYNMGAHKYMTCIFIGHRKDAKEYHPRITLTKHVISGGFSLALKVELSLPKLLFGNNFNELNDGDIDAIIDRLHHELLAAGIMLQRESIANAAITKIHYGKNTLLTNATAALVLSTLAKLNISRRLDASNTDYRNSGHAVRYHTNDWELAFYDKLKDLEQAKISERRAIEAQNATQIGLLDDLRRRQIEILRIECRLNKRQQIKSHLHRCNIHCSELTLRTLYSKQIARAIMLDFWDRYVQPSLGTLLLSKNTPEELFTALKLAGLKDAEILKLIGVLCFIDQHGTRRLRQALSTKGNTYHRIVTKLQAIKYPENYMASVFTDIARAIRQFESIRPIAM